MSMKKTDLEKRRGSKIAGGIRQAGPPDRFGAAASAVPDRRERRRLDQARGLVPFAAKLDGTLVARLRERAEGEGKSVDEVLDALLREALGQPPAEEAPGG